jgi:putative FmdB family regulatory protein
VPTYQYACTACEEQLEVVQRFSDDPLTVCPACGGRLRKQFSPVGIVFKGSGFYRNDSRSSSSSAANGSKDKAVNGSGTDSAKDGKPSGADTKPASSGSDSSSGESKPAKKADPASPAKPSSTGTKVA